MSPPWTSPLRLSTRQGPISGGWASRSGSSSTTSPDSSTSADRSTSWSTMAPSMTYQRSSGRPTLRTSSHSRGRARSSSFGPSSGSYGRGSASRNGPFRLATSPCHRGTWMQSSGRSSTSGGSPAVWASKAGPEDNLYPAAAIFGSAAPGFSSGQALTLMEQLAAQTLPEGMSYDWTSTSYQEKKAGTKAS